MKAKPKVHYLSTRIATLTALQLVLVLLFIVLCFIGLFQDEIYKHVMPIIALVLEGVLVLCAYVYVLRPYTKWKHQTNLFLEGYTLSPSGDGNTVALSRTSNELLDRVQKEFDSSHMLKYSKRQAQYRALQNQINPHFLYNTLESIRSEALVAGLESVADMTEALAVFFRYTISKVENLVTIEEELQNCVTYFHIQQYRFGSRLQFQIECDPEDRKEIYHCRIPKLTLQPILENSIIHGTELMLGTGKLVVKLERTKELLIITVSDNGVGMDEPTLVALNERLNKSGRAFQDNHEERGGVALTNVKNRIHLLFGEEYGLHVFSMPNVGTDVQITLPIITNERDIMHHEVSP